MIRSSLLALFLAFVALAASHPLVVNAQTWPNPGTPITMMMGFPAGSGVDVVARIVQEPMERALGTKIVVDYRTGAGGNLASDTVAKARADGYTILLGTAATHGVNAALYRKLPFDVESDFVAIAPIVDVSNVLTINPTVIDAKSIGEFIAQVKAAPGKFNFASTGNGTGTHLAFAEFNAKAGLDMVHVPYKGGPEALQSVLAGTTCCIFNQVQTVLAQSKAGKVRLLGVTTKARVAAVPDIPTIDEAGLRGFESYIWFGFFGPKGLDPAIAERINAAVKSALQTPAVRERLINLGNVPRIETVEQFRATVKEDRAKWAAVVKASGATVD
ncbi:MAG: tripartite tricarboxylate transporter substrate binding protein [Burkholderiales bacterium]